MGWTLPSPSVAGASNYANAPLLGHVTGAWFLPTDYLLAVSPLASISPGFDILGRDIPTSAALGNAVFCVHLRETWLAQNAAAPTDSLMRVEMRVVWPRINASPTGAPSLCQAASVTTVSPSPLLYSTLYMVTAVRANGLQ
jgi:hypothetical protein